MKIQDIQVEVVGDLQVAEEVPMGIHAVASGHIMKLLTNLYTNPAAAVLREYTANAWDSHYQGKQKKPVEVTLPSRLSPSFVVQDFGVGMSREQLKLFGQYGFSSKSDDDVENGGFGLGSKVGLAVSDQFTIRSVQGGYEDVVVIGMNENANPVLKFLYLTPQKTTKPDGVSVTIPVSNPDEFQGINLDDFFVGWEPGTIKVNGRLNATSVHDEDMFTSIDGFGYKATPKAPRGYQRNSYESYHRGMALVGPVRYDINWDEIPEMTDTLAGSYFNDIIVQIPIGAVDLVPSRETLRYTERTKDALATVIRELVDRGKATYVKQINDAATFRDALKVRKKAFDQGFVDEYTYNGVSMTPKTYDEKTIKIGTTWASVSTFVTSNGKNTLRTDRSSGTLNGMSWRSLVEGALMYQEPVLVMGTPDDRKFTSNNGWVHESAKISSNLARALVETTLVAADAPRKLDFLYTSATESELDEATKGAFALTIEWDDARRYAEAKRKEIASAAQRGVKRGKKTAGDTPVKVLSVFDYGRGYTRETTVSALNTDTKYILLGHDSVGRSMYSAIATVSGYKSRPELSSAAMRLSNAGYVFITHNKSWKTSSYSSLLTLVDYKDALREVVKAEYDRFDPADIAAVNSYENSTYSLSWARQMPKANVKTVLQKETREWLETLGSIRELSLKLDKLRELHKVALNAGVDLTGIDITGTVSGQDFGLRYKMLNDIYINRYTDWELISEYINFIDSK